MKKLHVLILFVFIASLVLAGCKPKTTTPTTSSGNTQPTSAAVETPVPVEPVVMKVGWAQNPDSLNPGVGMLNEAYVIYELVYSAMYERLMDGTYVFDAAESMTMSDDALTYTFKLKPNLKFSDDTPLTAKDVAFSYNLYKTHEDFPYMNTYTVPFDSVTAPDDTTVVLKLSQVVPDIRYQLVFLYILPEHIWAEQETNGKAAEFENYPLVGSGPFKVIDYAQGEYVHLGKNQNWYGKQPKIDEIVFQAFSNEDAMVQAIKTGQVDMITEMPLTAVASLKETPNVVVATGSPLAPDVTDILINQVSPENCPTADGGICSGHPALRDKIVREALAFATDKRQLIDVVLLGMGNPGVTLIPDSLVPWFNTSIKDRGYDIAKANTLLDDAGYKDVNNDGVREMPDGKTSLDFRLNWANSSTINERVSKLLVDQYKQIGVKLELQALDEDTLTSVCCPAFDYDLILWGWGSDPDPAFLLSVMLTREIPTGMSETGYSNSQYDELFDKQSVTVDPEARKGIVWQMQQIIYDDVTYIIPFYSLAVQAYRSDRFTNWPVNEAKLALDDVNSFLQVEPAIK